MSSPLGPLAERAYSLLRIIGGFLFSVHGIQKVFGVLTAQPSPAFGSQMWIGGLIELVCGLAICVGLFTSLAAFLACGTMAVAYFQFHWKFQLGAEFFPAVNGGELAVLYCFLFLYVACRGSGRWSLDAKRGRSAG